MKILPNGFLTKILIASKFRKRKHVHPYSFDYEDFKPTIRSKHAKVELKNSIFGRVKNFEKTFKLEFGVNPLI